MPFIGLMGDDKAPEVGELFEADRARLGYVPNYTRLFAHRPEVSAGWQALNGAIKRGMELRRYELATLAAARRLRSSYCSLAHGKILAERFFPPSAVRDIVSGRTNELDEVDRAVMDLAEKVAADATSVTQTDIDRLRGLGLRDEEVFDVVLAAAARSFFSKTLDALGVLPDGSYMDLEPELREVLTVGRPIEAAG